MENKQAAVSMRKITKAFGTKVVANKDVDLDIYKGEILSLLDSNKWKEVRSNRFLHI